MSIRSILEFNHDQAHAIVSSPDDFLFALRCYLASADQRNANELRRFGITIMSSHHHSADVEITLTNAASGITTKVWPKEKA